MEKKCLECGERFDAATVRAKYCSDVCRQRGHRVTVTEGESSVTEIPRSVTSSVTENSSVTDDEVGTPARVLDLVRDLKLNLEKDLGVTGWSADGIFLKPDITVDQVQNIARLIHAKHGHPCPEFRECR